jgi:hypothetical protein
MPPPPLGRLLSARRRPGFKSALVDLVAATFRDRSMQAESALPAVTVELLLRVQVGSAWTRPLVMKNLGQALERQLSIAFWP